MFNVVFRDLLRGRAADNDAMCCLQLGNKISQCSFVTILHFLQSSTVIAKPLIFRKMTREKIVNVISSQGGSVHRQVVPSTLLIHQNTKRPYFHFAPHFSKDGEIS